MQMPPEYADLAATQQMNRRGIQLMGKDDTGTAYFDMLANAMGSRQGLEPAAAHQAVNLAAELVGQTNMPQEDASQLIGALMDKMNAQSAAAASQTPRRPSADSSAPSVRSPASTSSSLPVTTCGPSML